MSSTISKSWLAFTFSVLTLCSFKVHSAPDLDEGWAEDPTRLHAGEVFKSRAELMHPTQFAVGLAEVRRKETELDKMSEDERLKLFKNEPIPVVLGPGGVIYTIDGHHETRALLDSGHSKLYAKVVENWLDIRPEQFWPLMEQDHYCYLFDEYGRGPLSPSALPQIMQQLPDDPYRTLASLVRHANGYEKSAEPFAEFKWAQYFREALRPELGGANTPAVISAETVAKAVRLAKSPNAANLPGYNGGKRN